MKKDQIINPLFSLEGNTATRNTIRASEHIKNTDGLYKVELDNIRIVPGFSPRQKPEETTEDMWNHILGIPELADLIYLNNGPIDPLLGDIYAEDTCFYVTEGERRTRALRHLIKTGRDTYPNGALVSDVRVLLNPPGTTDLERKRIAISSASKLPFTIMQRARYYKSFADKNDKTHEEIAEYLGISRQTVDNYILACDFPTDTQMNLDAGTITLSAALEAYREANPKRKPSKKNEALVDTESGEILSEFQEKKLADKEKEKEKLRGDEDDFIQQDNSIKGASSKGGPKEESSGAHVIGTDSIYMQDKQKACWKQFLNRYEVIKEQVISSITFDVDANMNQFEDKMVLRLMNEFNLTVK